jgi:hypothetical protein
MHTVALFFLAAFVIGLCCCMRRRRRLRARCRERRAAQLQAAPMQQVQYTGVPPAAPMHQQVPLAPMAQMVHQPAHSGFVVATATPPQFHVQQMPQQVPQVSQQVPQAIMYPQVPAQHQPVMYPSQFLVPVQPQGRYAPVPSQ